MLTDKLRYKISIDFAGSYTVDEKDKPLLSLRIYIYGNYENPPKQYGINLSSIPSNEYDYVAQDLGTQIKRWILMKYPEEGDEDFDPVKYLKDNRKLREKFERYLECKIESIKNCGMDSVEMNYQPKEIYAY